MYCSYCWNPAGITHNPPSCFLPMSPFNGWQNLTDFTHLEAVLVVWCQNKQGLHYDGNLVKDNFKHGGMRWREQLCWDTSRKKMPLRHACAGAGCKLAMAFNGKAWGCGICKVSQLDRSLAQHYEELYLCFCPLWEPSSCAGQSPPSAWWLSSLFQAAWLLTANRQQQKL